MLQLSHPRAEYAARTAIGLCPSQGDYVFSSSSTLFLTSHPCLSPANVVFIILFPRPPSPPFYPLLSVTKSTKDTHTGKKSGLLHHLCFCIRAYLIPQGSVSLFSDISSVSILLFSISASVCLSFSIHPFKDKVITWSRPITRNVFHQPLLK